MSHYFTIPINSDGIVADPNIAKNLQNALNSPFSVSDVFIYSHGWWNSATSALSNYNRFSVELSAAIARIAGQQNPVLTQLPSSPLGVAVHWPSMISDDDQALINKLESLSFYTMAHRANQVGKNAVYSILRLLIEQSPKMPRLHFLGHSFGCRVVCSAIQEILNDSFTIPDGKDLAINAVLLEAAFDQNDLEQGEVYGGLCRMPNLRLLATFSALDRALTHDYPLSQEINIFKGPGGSNAALGGLGPTPKMTNDFGGTTPLIINPGFNYALSAAPTTRLVTANLTPLHQSRPNYPDVSHPNQDHHSDVFLPEIYELICGFLFK